MEEFSKIMTLHLFLAKIEIGAGQKDKIPSVD